MQVITTKILFFDSLERFLLNAGLSSGFTDFIIFVIVSAILLILMRLLDWIGSRVIATVVHAAVKRTRTKWDDFLMERKFYRRIINFFVAIILMAMAQTLFQGFSPGVIKITLIVINIYVVLTALRAFNAFMSAVNDVYETRPEAKRKSIRSIVQAIKIAVAVVVVILIISIIIDKSPSDLLVAIGASAAIVSLVFRDTILGFVASIQVSAQEMIRPGDWIEMPTKGADGFVSEINVMNVKVRNWDNSMTMVPIYSLVSESFTNWRNMLESAGRRFTRPILIDINSIKILNPEEIDLISSHPAIAPEVAKRMIGLHKSGNSSSFTTNVGLFRCYVEAYLKNHPKVAQNQLLTVRYLPNTENGITIQVYAFSTEKLLLDYERVISDIFEHVMVVASLFDLKMYQRPLSSPPATPPLDIFSDSRPTPEV